MAGFLGVFFFFNDTAPPEISPLSLHDALPISFSPVPTIGGGVVLDPFSPPHTRLRRRRLSLEQVPAARLGVLAVEAGRMGLATHGLALRLGVAPGGGGPGIAGAGEEGVVAAENLSPPDAVLASTLPP